MNESEQHQGFRVLVIDEYPAMRMGVAQILGMWRHAVAAEADTRESALSRLRQGGIELVVLDVAQDRGGGMRLLAELSGRGVPVLVYSGQEAPDTIVQALLHGARGYVGKRERPKVLLAALAEVMAGGSFLSPRVELALAERSRLLAAAEAAPGLSAREREILQLLSSGDSRQEIAAALSISPRTVDTYFKRMVAKLGLADIKALRKLAIPARPVS